jgi:hypothetical protein
MARLKDLFRTFGLPLGFVLGLVMAWTMAASAPTPLPQKEYLTYVVVRDHFRYKDVWQDPTTMWIVVIDEEGKTRMKIIPAAFKRYWDEKLEGTTVPLPSTWTEWREPVQVPEVGVLRMYLDGAVYRNEAWEGNMYQVGTRYYSKL